MDLITTLLVVAAAAPTGTWAGSSAAAPSVSLQIKSGTVTQASAWTSSYVCELGGFVGPAQVKVTPRAKISSGGRISFTSGTRSRKLRASLRYSRGRIGGTIRIVGNAGGPCSSPAVSVNLRKR